MTGDPAQRKNMISSTSIGTIGSIKGPKLAPMSLHSKGDKLSNRS